ncbi:signal peptidase I [uncultured Arsenicicoccus sp.]|uniref:signal peptidase I n=1 Tax=uncultured Arsenicicoccus sp. TaxID=491339 RepID=UPI0025930522|nr:signal peptidase I [uncultured Arsenicicoccus sp.]
MHPRTTMPTPTDTSVAVGISRRSRHLLVVVVLAWVALVAVRTWVVDWFVVPSGSMEPLLRPGERILVDKTTQGVRRGEVVVFDGTGTFDTGDGPPLPVRLLGRAFGASPGHHLVKRVVGVGGDHVRCCDDQGRLTVDGRPLDEPYLHAGDTPSEVRFDVVVPPGRLWVLGDHRSRSADSRSRLGSPGGGLLPERDVTGRVIRVLWPPGHWRAVAARPDPTTPGGTR